MKIKRFAAMLIVALGLTAFNFAKAQTSGGGFGNLGNIGPSGGQVAGAIIGAGAAVGIITYLAIHYSKKRAITGCVVSQGDGMTVTDEKDHQTYLLSGDTADITPGARLKLSGKKIKPRRGESTLGWKATKVKKNFGGCSAQS
ncbi:MAG TPA: hypothetical protein VJP83_16070 [Terriglobales bacterium]|nr:hypothetical protein [Terriglobales bacterium]